MSTFSGASEIEQLLFDANAHPPSGSHESKPPITSVRYIPHRDVKDTSEKKGMS